eukprot:COSAG02_NODE_7635_length_2923_cov_1.481941_1_plen_20_part_10
MRNKKQRLEVVRGTSGALHL